MNQNLLKPLDRDAYLKRVAKRQVPLADGSVVCIRALPASLIVSGAQDDGAKAFESANLLVQSLCDEDGALLFTTEEKDMAMTIDYIGLKAVLDAITELNGLKAPTDGEAGEAAEKN